MLLCVDRKMTCKTWESNQSIIQSWLYPVLSAAASEREAITKIPKRDSKNRKTFRKMCPLRKGRGKRSLREDMIRVLPTQKRMAIKEDDEISCSL